jgi:hypothetical protein
MPLRALMGAAGRGDAKIILFWRKKRGIIGDWGKRDSFAP